MRILHDWLKKLKNWKVIKETLLFLQTKYIWLNSNVIKKWQPPPPPISTSIELPFVFWKGFILGKSKWSAAWFYYVSVALKLAYNRNKLFKTLHYWSRDMLNFGILDKGLWIISPAHFVYDLSTKMFLIFYSINWSNLIVWSPLLLEILGSMCIAIVC